MELPPHPPPHGHPQHPPQPASHGRAPAHMMGAGPPTQPQHGAQNPHYQPHHAPPPYHAPPPVPHPSRRHLPPPQAAPSGPPGQFNSQRRSPQHMRQHHPNAASAPNNVNASSLNPNVKSNGNGYEWQSDHDMDLRARIMQHIVKLLKSQQRGGTNEEWLNKLPSMVKQLEFSLYTRAKSREEYLNLESLKSRLSELANEIHEKSKAAAAARRRSSITSSAHVTSNRTSSVNRTSSNNVGQMKDLNIGPGSSGGGNSSNNGTTSQSATESSKIRYRQQRLLLLQHSSKCEKDPCDVTKHCAELKKLWKHLEVCKVANSKDKHCREICPYPHCNSSYLVLSHYKNCKVECEVCEPVRRLIRKKKADDLKRKQHASSRDANNGTPVTNNYTSQQQSKNISGHGMPMPPYGSNNMGGGLYPQRPSMNRDQSVHSQTSQNSNNNNPNMNGNAPIVNNSRSITNGMMSITNPHHAQPAPGYHPNPSPLHLKHGPPPTHHGHLQQPHGVHSSSNQSVPPSQMRGRYDPSPLSQNTIHMQNPGQRRASPITRPQNQQHSKVPPLNSMPSSNTSGMNSKSNNNGAPNGVHANMELHALRLMILRHSHRCSLDNCPIPACASFRDLWRHIHHCHDNQCQRKSCYSSRRILQHYKTCKKSDCQLCMYIQRFKNMNDDRILYKVEPLPSANTDNPHEGLNGNNFSGNNNLQRRNPSSGSVAISNASRKRRMDEFSSNQPPKTKVPRNNTNDPTYGSLNKTIPSNPEIGVSSSRDISRLDRGRNNNRSSSKGLVGDGAVCKPVTSGKSNRSNVTMLSILTAAQLKSHIESLHPLQCLTINAISTLCKGILKRLREEEQSWIFNTPVDTEAWGLDDYHDIIKHPMDYSTIEKRLDQGQYSKLDGFASDIRMVYSNAKTYNAPGTSVHTLAMETLSLFEKEYEKGVALTASNMDASKSGDVCVLCLKSKRTYTPPVYICSGSKCPHVKIRRGNNFYTSFNINFCTQCYSHLPDKLEVEGNTIVKNQLIKKKNDEVNEEGWVQCDECKHWIHQICGLFNSRENKGSNVLYTCPACLLKKKNKEGVVTQSSNSNVLVKSKEAHNLRAKALIRTKLSDILEAAIVKVVMESGIKDVPGLCVRQVTSRQCLTLVREQMAKTYGPRNYPAEFPFRNKCLLLFQKIDGVDVLLFALYVYEYGADCPEPNRNRTYISYLDSVHYLRPKELRTAIYHEILIQYFDYARKNGFEHVHIWSCPPARGDDYIFYAKPESQRIPKEARLRKWYQNMLVQAMKRGIIEKTDNMYDLYFDEKTPRDAVLVPYLDGDYFIGEAENVLTSIAAKESKSGSSSKDGSDKESKDKSKKRTSNNSSSSVDFYVDPLMAKVGNTVQPMKESFFEAKLASIKSEVRSGKDSNPVKVEKESLQAEEVAPVITTSETSIVGKKPDKISSSSTKLKREKSFPSKNNSEEVLDEDKETFDCEILNSRQDFLNLCKGNHYQFDELRRAKHTSMMVLWHLHNNDAPKFVQQCTMCQAEINSGFRFHCSVCPDFDLCGECNREKPGKCLHGHVLKPIQVDNQSDGSNGTSQASALAARRAQQQSIELHVRLLEHASSCSSECKSRNCPRMKHYLKEYMKCKQKVATNNGGRSSSCGCRVCKKIRAMIGIHAQRCKKKNCMVPDCEVFKEKIRQMMRQQQAMDDRRRREMNRIYRESDN